MSTAIPAPFTPAPLSAAAPDGVGTPPQAVMPSPIKGSPPKKEIPSVPNKVIGAKIITYYRGDDGRVHEASTYVDPEEYIVQKFALDVDEKYTKAKDENGNVVGFEDTGERILKFVMRYHVR